MGLIIKESSIAIEERNVSQKALQELEKAKKLTDELNTKLTADKTILKKKLQDGLKGYSKWELFAALVFRSY